MLNTLLAFIRNEIVFKGLIVGVVGGALVAYLNENLRVLRESYLLASACRKLASRKSKRIKRGVMSLLEIANRSPFRRQEMVDIITRGCFRRYYGRENNPANPTHPEMVELFGVALKAVLSLPREDANGHSLNFDFHQLALASPEGESIYLEKLNCRDTVLWGSEFVRVDFSRSVFRNCDLGGVMFEDCGLEDLDLEGAKFSFSPLDKRPTIFRKSWMSRSNVDSAHVLQSRGTQVVFSQSEVDGGRLERLRAISPGVVVE